jgi:hypothetical protein
MNPFRRTAAGVLSLLIAVPVPGWSCGLFGARIQEAVATGAVAGSVRTEMLVAKYDRAARAPFVVKLFVGPAGAAVRLKQVSDEEKQKYDAIGKTANNVLNPPMQTRGLTFRGVPHEVDSLVVGDIKASVLDVSNQTWEQIRDRFGIASDQDQYYKEWVQRVAAENKRGLYAAYIDVRQVADPAELDKLFRLAVTIPYSGSGSALIQQVALDKWLEYKGARGIASGFGTDWSKTDAVAALTSVMTDWDLADKGGVVSTQEDGGGTDMIIKFAGRDKGIITFTLSGDSSVALIYKNQSYTLDAHTAANPRAAGGAERRAPKISLPGSPF